MTEETYRDEAGPPTAGVLSGMRVVEAAAFVAAPLGGMTLAQMGADVIRIDPLAGGLDYRRWPVTNALLNIPGISTPNRAPQLLLAWQAAQNKQTGVRIDQRREGRLANQKTMPSPYIAVAMTVNGSSSF